MDYEAPSMLKHSLLSKNIHESVKSGWVMISSCRYHTGDLNVLKLKG